MRVLSLVLAFVGLIYLVIIITGYLIGPDNFQEKTFEVDYSAQSVWDVLDDINRFELKREVKNIEILGRYQDLFAWIENLERGGFKRYRQVLKQESLDRDRKLEIEITQSSFGLTGTWTFELDEEKDVTVIKITEDSTTDSVFHRGYRFYLGQDIEVKYWERFIRSQLFQRLITTP
jgi:hypothetical protein